MSKFAVNDSVRDKGLDQLAVVKAVRDDGYILVYWEKDGYKAKDGVNHNFWPPSDFELVRDGATGPIRTVTRREIVPGVYGRVHVCQVDKENKVFINLNEDGEKWTPCRNTTTMDATELRDAAHILNQLAEALDDA